MTKPKEIKAQAPVEVFENIESDSQGGMTVSYRNPENEWCEIYFPPGAAKDLKEVIYLKKEKPRVTSDYLSLHRVEFPIKSPGKPIPLFVVKFVSEENESCKVMMSVERAEDLIRELKSLIDYMKKTE